MGGPTLRLYRPCQCFLRVGLSPSKLVNGGDQGLQGTIWLGLWHPLASLWPAFGSNWAAKTASKRKQNSTRKFVAKMIEIWSLGAPKSGLFLSRKTRLPSSVFGLVAPGCPKASRGSPKPAPGLPLGCFWCPFGFPLDLLEVILGSFWHPLGSL